MDQKNVKPTLFVCVFCDCATNERLPECPDCGCWRCFASRIVWHRLQIAGAVAWLLIGGVLAWVVGWMVWPHPYGRNFPEAWWVFPLVVGCSAIFLAGGIAGLFGRPWLYRVLAGRLSGGWFGK